MPSLSFTRTADGLEFPSDIRAVTLTHGGSVFRKFRGSFPTGKVFAGATGIDPGAFDFLAFGNRKFSIIPATSVGWVSY